MTGDSSGGGYDYAGAVESIAGVGQKLTGYIKGWQSLFGGHERGSGRMAARGMAALAAAQARQAAKLASKQFAFAQSLQFPESPVYGQLGVVTQYELPTKLTSKQTKINQALMIHPDSKKLMAKQQKIGAKIGRFIAHHPEAATQYAVTRK